MDKKTFSELLETMERIVRDMGMIKTSLSMLNNRVARMEDHMSIEFEQMNKEVGNLKKHLSQQDALIENGFMEQSGVILDGTKMYIDKKLENHELAFHG